MSRGADSPEPERSEATGQFVCKGFSRSSAMLLAQQSLPLGLAELRSV